MYLYVYYEHTAEINVYIGSCLISFKKLYSSQVPTMFFCREQTDVKHNVLS